MLASSPPIWTISRAPAGLLRVPQPDPSIPEARIRTSACVSKTTGCSAIQSLRGASWRLRRTRRPKASASPASTTTANHVLPDIRLNVLEMRKCCKARVSLNAGKVANITTGERARRTRPNRQAADPQRSVPRNRSLSVIGMAPSCGRRRDSVIRSRRTPGDNRRKIGSRAEGDAHGALPKRLHVVRPLDRHIARSVFSASAKRTCWPFDLLAQVGLVRFRGSRATGVVFAAMLFTCGALSR